VTPDGQSVRVLVVEDDALVAFDLEVLLKAAGYSVVGPVGRLEEAVAMASEGLFDVALLDIHLRGEEVYPVADILVGRGIPFMFLSGYGEGDLPSRFHGRPLYRKPYSIRSLIARLGASLSM
jgi:DNA-binding response OmpR family regulator